MELQKTKDISYALKTIEGHFPAAFRPVAASPRQAEPQATGYRQVRIDPLANPVRYFVEVMRMVYLKGSGFADLRGQFVIVCLFAVFFNLLAVISYRKKG